MLPPPAYTSHASKKFRQWLPQNCCVYQSTRFNRRFFFLEHAGELRIFILRGEKGVGPNYRVQLLSLDQREGCRNMLEMLQKRKTLGPDHLTLITLHWFYQPYRVQGCKALSHYQTKQFKAQPYLSGEQIYSDIK